MSGAEFDKAYQKVKKIKINYVSMETLIDIKKSVGRVQDKLDVKLLKNF